MKNTTLVVLFALAACGERSDSSEIPDCERGAKDCPCERDDQCSDNPAGVSMVCDEGICACNPGTLGCDCLDADACGAGLVCSAALGAPLCVTRDLCPQGVMGCPCYADETCDVGSNNRAMVCDAGQCVLDQCERGERGCGCLPGDRCVGAGDICDMGLCVEDTGQTVVAPAAPRCFTPCRGDLVEANGQVLQCDSDGLVEACVDGSVCVDGSCLTTADIDAGVVQASACSFDAQCPSFQACIDGRCYSDCDTDLDCRDDGPVVRECYQRVCRVACTGAGDQCPEREYCKAVDGAQGYCMPLGVPLPSQIHPNLSVAQQPESTRAVFAFTSKAHSVSVATQDVTLFLQNDTTRKVQFTLSKAKHTYPEADTTQLVEDDNALKWLSLAVEAGGKTVSDNGGRTVGFALEAGERATIQVSHAAPPSESPAYERYVGTLRATSDDGVSDDATLSFGRTPAGSWSGNAYYFGNFPDRGLSDWLVAKDDINKVRAVGNALVRKWDAYRRGLISTDEFKAILLATENDSWRDPIVKSKCPNEAEPSATHACYPYSNATGIGHYSDDFATAPIPSGVVQLPMAITIEVDKAQNDQKKWVGRIDSAESLQYPGNPTLRLSFASDPSTCPASGACVQRVSALDVTTYLGGRQPMPASGICPTYDGVAYEKVRVPWLVPHFLADAHEDTSDGSYYREDCRDPRFPGPGSAERPRNLVVAGSNPINDGRTLARKVELLDGAMVDQTTLFILFRESVPSFLDATGTMKDYGYGYFLLSRADADRQDDDIVPGAVGAELKGTPRGPSCTANVIDRVLGQNPATLTNTQWRQVGTAMVTGVVPPGDGELIAAADENDRVHWLCLTPGAGYDKFDVPCTGESLIFATEGLEIDDVECEDDICRSDDPCAKDASCTVGAACPTKHQEGAGACEAQVLRWAEKTSYDIVIDPVCKCESDESSCDLGCSGANTSNLRAGKTFFASPSPGVISATPKAGQPTVHYLCHETGHFDVGTGDPQVACPAASKVTYFAYYGSADLARHACQTAQGICRAGEECSRVQANDAGTGVSNQGCAVGQRCAAKADCEATFDSWLESATAVELTGYHCKDASVITCQDAPDGKSDLRANKTFFLPQAETVAYPDIDIAIESAFRYRTRFMNREGLGVGFAPDACVAGDNSVPYCYDAEAIEDIRARVDCAEYVYTQQYEKLDASTKTILGAFLERAMSFHSETVPGAPFPVTRDGFERLYAELLVMLGDESLTRAFASRFDLAGVSLADFEGPAFEADGLALSGKAGFELYSLYQSVQYFQLALDRFFDHGPTFAESLDDDAVGPPLAEGFITARTATSYLPRIVGASTKKATAWSAVARKYASFNRADLAREVIERAYAQAYSESIIVLQILDRVAQTVSAEEKAQLVLEKETAQITYASALREMASIYKDELSDEPNFFGIDTNFVPIPPIDTTDINLLETNAFDVAFGQAWDKLDLALASERKALDSKREFDTDEASFQSELSNIRRTHEAELGELCGTFVGDDGNIYAAIPKNATQSALTRGMGNPCGLVGTGDIAEQVAELGAYEGRASLIDSKKEALDQKVVDTEAKMKAQCARIKALNEWTVKRNAEIRKLGAEKAAQETAVEAFKTVKDKAKALKEALGCSVGTSTDCPNKAMAVTGFIATSVVQTVKLVKAGKKIQKLNDSIEAMENGVEEGRILEECKTIEIDTQFAIKELFRDYALLGNEAEIAEAELTAQLIEIDSMYNEAQAGIASFDEAQQMAVNVAVAHNDPNQRIYKNEAIITADDRFFDALRAAYVATKVYEYYTSQTYAAREDLLIIRLAGEGDKSLESYLIDLQDAFNDFEFRFGQPDLRLMIVSLRDATVARLGQNAGKALTEDQRRNEFRAEMKRLTQADPRGYLAFPLVTELGQVSPLTANHKVLYVEAELVGQNLGDDLGRLYVRQDGTGVLRRLDGEKDYRTFPKRTAVMNTIFNGRRGSPTLEFNESLYRSFRLRDRPVINTAWEVALNPIDEEVNKDIDLDGLEDVVLYIYYTDFTFTEDAQ